VTNLLTSCSLKNDSLALYDYLGKSTVPELPDIFVLARSMDKALRNRQVDDATVNQPKCLNVSPRRFVNQVKGRHFVGFRQRGKWILSDLDGDWVVALNLGMGGEIRLHAEDETPVAKREKVIFRLDNGQQVWIHHWWFGHVHLVPRGRVDSHPQIGHLGPEPLADDFTVDDLRQMLEGKRGWIKKYLLDQRFIAGIGNVYVQDMLWYARLHPKRTADSLTRQEIEGLYRAIRGVLSDGIRYGGGPGEQDIWGNKGRYQEHFRVGYKTGKACPECGTMVEELRVGSTTSYMCPHCQV